MTFSQFRTDIVLNFGHAQIVIKGVLRFWIISNSIISDDQE